MTESVFRRIYKQRRVWAILAVLLMVVLLITVPGGDKSKVFAESNSDLSNFVSAVDIYDKNKQKVEPNPEYDLTGQVYNIDIHYSEEDNKDGFEFVNGDDGAPASMTYH